MQTSQATYWCVPTLLGSYFKHIQICIHCMLTPYLDSEIEANTVIDLAQTTTHFSWLKSYVVEKSTIASRMSHLTYKTVEIKMD